MANRPFNAFEMAQTQFDKIADLLELNQATRDLLRTPLREYQFNDDVRYIDWNVTARMQTPYVRQYNEDREVTAWFLLDLSPSVDFGTLRTLKRNLLIDFVAVIARLLNRLEPHRHELVLFDINREAAATSLLIADPGPLTNQLMTRDTLPFSLTGLFLRSNFPEKYQLNDQVRVTFEDEQGVSHSHTGEVVRTSEKGCGIRFQDNDKNI